MALVRCDAMQRPPVYAVLAVLVAAVGVSCSSDASSSSTPSISVSEPASTVVESTGAVTTAATTTAATTAAVTTVVDSGETLATTIDTTAPSTTAVDTTSPPTTPPDVETRLLGRSVEGRDINAVRRGEPGGRVVLVIGVIHGDEHDGLAIMDRLHTLPVPGGVDLWLVDSMNPDGVAANVRHNANQVDLNRNFPYNWGPIGVAGDSQYAGPSAASEPETQAMVAFIDEIRPDLVIWYHQDLFRIAPGTGRDGVIRARYAELTGLPVVSITGGTYTGVAATWARKTLDPGVAFIVELGASVSGVEADTHAAAVLTVAAEPN
jgi:murein peptide amidase A